MLQKGVACRPRQKLWNVSLTKTAFTNRVLQRRVFFTSVRNSAIFDWFSQTSSPWFPLWDFGQSDFKHHTTLWRKEKCAPPATKVDDWNWMSPCAHKTFQYVNMLEGPDKFEFVFKKRVSFPKMGGKFDGGVQGFLEGICFGPLNIEIAKNHGEDILGGKTCFPRWSARFGLLSQNHIFQRQHIAPIARSAPKGNPVFWGVCWGLRFVQGWVYAAFQITR